MPQHLHSRHFGFAAAAAAAAAAACAVAAVAAMVAAGVFEECDITGCLCCAKGALGGCRTGGQESGQVTPVKHQLLAHRGGCLQSSAGTLTDQHVSAHQVSICLHTSRHVLPMLSQPLHCLSCCQAPTHPCVLSVLHDTRRAMEHLGLTYHDSEDYDCDDPVDLPELLGDAGDDAGFEHPAPQVSCPAQCQTSGT